MSRSCTGSVAAAILVIALAVTPGVASGRPIQGSPAGSHGAPSPRTELDWTQDRFDASHAGSNPFETKIRKRNVAALQFEFGLQGNFIASPLEVAGLIDVPYEGRLDAIRPTGVAVWTRSFKGGLAGAPVGGNGSIYVPTPTTLYELDATTGHVLFTWVDTPSDGEAVLTDTTVYVHTATQLVAIDRQTRAPRWTHAVSVDAVPAVAGGVVYEPTTSLRLVALDEITGNKVWGPVASTGNPAVADGMVFTMGPVMLTALDALTGATRWQASGSFEQGIPAVANGSVYASVNFDPISIEAFDASTGTPRWSTEVAKRGLTAITLVKGLVFAACESGVVVLDTDGKQRTTLTTLRPWNFAVAPPTVVNGHVYFYATGKRFVFAAYG